MNKYHVDFLVITLALLASLPSLAFELSGA
jgi:hypothetical protein